MLSNAPPASRTGYAFAKGPAPPTGDYNLDLKRSFASFSSQKSSRCRRQNETQYDLRNIQISKTTKGQTGRHIVEGMAKGGKRDATAKIAEKGR